MYNVDIVTVMKIRLINIAAFHAIGFGRLKSIQKAWQRSRHPNSQRHPENLHPEATEICQLKAGVLGVRVLVDPRPIPFLFSPRLG